MYSRLPSLRFGEDPHDRTDRQHEIALKLSFIVVAVAVVLQRPWVGPARHHDSSHYCVVHVHADADLVLLVTMHLRELVDLSHALRPRPNQGLSQRTKASGLGEATRSVSSERKDDELDERVGSFARGIDGGLGAHFFFL